jgi:hypothetical protein
LAGNFNETDILDSTINVWELTHRSWWMMDKYSEMFFLLTTEQ